MDVLTEEEHTQFLWVCRKGMLFEVQEWFDSGKGSRRPPDKRTSGLISAAEKGFHSLVRVLLDRGEFDDRETEAALIAACERGHHEIAKLLVLHGVPASHADFYAIASYINREFMGFMLDHGTDPGIEDGFAGAFVSTKAKPLLGVYRDYRDKVPALQEQMALALIDCIKRDDEKGVLLICWAGIDPLLKVCPWPRCGDEEDSWRECAARTAVWEGKPQFLKLLRIKPSQSQLRELLESITMRPNAEVVAHLLSLTPGGLADTASLLNDRPDGTSSFLTEVLHCRPDWGNRGTDARQENLESLKLLIHHGAKWGPDPILTIRNIRRALYDTSPEYAAEVIRILWSSPEACPPSMTREMATAPKMREWLQKSNPVLLRKILQIC